MQYLETIIEYISDLLGDIDYAGILSNIWDAIEYIISLVS